jgi:hypothetical protein
VQPAGRTPSQLIEPTEFSWFDLRNRCWEYLNLTIAESLAHTSPLINAPAILDKRLGKQRFVPRHPKTLHSMVKGLLEFRLSAEGLFTDGARRCHLHL